MTLLRMNTTAPRKGASRSRSIALLWLSSLLPACGQDPAPPAPPPPEAAFPAPPAGPSRTLRLDPASMAAQAPFGMLRIAPDGALDTTARNELALRHARVPSGPDVVLTISSGSEQPAEPPRWSATPGRLVGALAGQGLLAEVTASPRVGFYRLSVLPGKPVRIDIAWRDPGGGDGVLSPARGRQALTGSLTTTEGTQLHLAVRFDHSFRLVAPVEGADPVPRSIGAAAGQPLALEFQPSDGVVRVRLALSTVDVGAARANLRELPGWDYDAALADTRAAWDQTLGRLRLGPQADAGDDGAGGIERPGDDDASGAALLAALYQVFARYGDITDSDGRYRSADGSVRRMPAGHAHIGNLDLEQEHGELLPLLDLLAPGRAADVAETLLAHQVATGRLPTRTAWGRETGGGAAHAPLLVLAGMVSRGTDGAEPERVLPPMIKPDPVYGAEPAWAALPPLHEFPAEAGAPGFVGRELRAARAHHAVALVAAALGDREVASAYAARSVLYRRLWNGRGGVFAPGAGGARSPVSDLSGGDEGPEAAPWTAGRFDIDSLLGVLGGRQALADGLSARLDTGSGGVVGEVPSPGPAFLPWLYYFSNDPDRGPGAVRRWRAAVAKGPSDAATSAATVFAALGLFPVLDTAGEYVLGAPTISRATLLRGDSELTIERDAAIGDASAGRILLDGTPLPGRTLAHRRLVEGAFLRFGAGEEVGRHGDE